MKIYKHIKIKLIPLLLAFILVFAALPVSGTAAFVASSEAADILYDLGLLKGSDAGYDLDRQLTKQEAVIMLVRLLGLEKAAINETDISCPFMDVDTWAKSYVSVAYKNQLVNGMSQTWLGAASQADANTFLTFILRALGYKESVDFTYQNADKFANKIGLINGDYTGTDYLLREDAVTLSYNALITPLKDSSKKLIEQLLEKGAIERDKLLGTSLSGYYNYGKTVYNAAEIYERTSAATFYLEVFDDEKSFEKGKKAGSASGFFISADGLALTCYHALELKPYARITTTDGKVFEDIKIISYDGYGDVAVLKIGKTAKDQTTVRAFPYITLGNSDGIASGSTVYTMSSPIGLQDCISTGHISSKNRIADDPAYPLIQFTAPISPGSSGGVLLNEYCEAIGVCKGAFTAGNALSLAIPINFISGLDMNGTGKTVLEVSEYDKALNSSSSLTVSQREITIKKGEEVEIIVTRDSPGSAGLKFEIGNDSIISCAWGSFTTKQTVPIYITGLAKGSTTISITYYQSGNPDAVALITVTVQ